MHAPTRCRITLAVIVVVCAGLLAEGAGADSGSTRADRDAIRAERAAAAAELEPLLAEDAELEAAVAELTAFTRTQQERVDAVRRRIEQTDERILVTEARIAAGEVERARLEALSVAVAVDAYIDASATGDSWLESDNLSEASRQRFLADSVVRDVDDVIDSVRGLEAQLAADEESLRTARAEAVTLREDEQARLDDLAAALAEQQRLEAALQARIDEFQGEVDALAAEEAQLSALLERELAQEAAAQRAIEEAQQRAARGDDSSPPPEDAPASARNLQWPVNGTLTSRYGPRWGRIHRGIDVGAPTGTAVRASGAGRVIQAGSNGNFGNSVIIDHGGGVVTLYGHFSSVSVSVGESVSQGETIGAVGCTGSCTGPHVHFEVRIGGVAYDPLVYLP